MSQEIFAIQQGTFRDVTVGWVSGWLDGKQVEVDYLVDLLETDSYKEIDELGGILCNIVLYILISMPARVSTIAR